MQKSDSEAKRLVMVCLLLLYKVGKGDLNTPLIKFKVGGLSMDTDKQHVKHTTRQNIQTYPPIATNVIYTFKRQTIHPITST